MIFLTFLYCLSTFGAETDQFSTRLVTLEDATEIINREINRRLEKVGNRLNSYSCDTEKLYQFLGQELRRPIYGSIEGWINQDKNQVPRHVISYEESIYQDLYFWENAPVHVYKIGLASTLKIDQVLIGSDKLGHFFDEGWKLFDIYQSSLSLEQSFAYSDFTEEGIYGGLLTGVISYADKVANFEGMKFWAEILGKTSKFETDRPFFICHDNRYDLKKSFDLRNYVHDGWDESLNCNDYRSIFFSQKVQRRLNMMGMICPVKNDFCQKMKEIYPKYHTRLIHPTCYN